MCLFTGEDSIDEDGIIVCCACVCANLGVLPTCGALGCSGKAGLLCLSCDFCLKPGASCLACCCCGPRCEYHGCSVCNLQCQMLCCVVTSAVPCTDESPYACAALGVTCFPSCGLCQTVKAVETQNMVR